MYGSQSSGVGCVVTELWTTSETETSAFRRNLGSRIYQQTMEQERLEALLVIRVAQALQL